MILSLSLDNYVNQSPLIPLIFSALSILIIIMQCFTKHTFYKVRLIASFVITFASALIFFFFDEVMGSDSTSNVMKVWKMIFTYGMIAIEVGVIVLLFTTIDFSLSNEKLHKILTKSLDETKFYVILDKKDKVKEISTLLKKDLGIEEKDCLGKNFFDVIEKKYRIIGINGEEAYKDDVKKYYDKYYKRAVQGKTGHIELSLQDDNAKRSTMCFNESTVFTNDKYKGRILIGETKGQDTLIGIEKELEEKDNELDLIKSRFITILGKTSDGIYFNNLGDKTIWFNDNLVKKLFLTGNVISSDDFYRNIHKDDIVLYRETLSNLKNDDYQITYRYNTGAYYIYVKEMGHKIVSGDTVELSGIMQVIDDYRFEKTDTILDTLKTEPELRAKIKSLEQSDKVFMIAYFKLNSIPEINEKYGRGIGSQIISEYVGMIIENFVTEHYIYRLSGLEFVAIITNYNRMEALKSNLRNDEKILHLQMEITSEKATLDVFMGIAYSNDTSNPNETLDNAKKALKIAENPTYNSSFAFFRDIK